MAILRGGWRAGGLRLPETRGRLFRLASGVARTEWKCWKRVPKMSGSAVWGGTTAADGRWMEAGYKSKMYVRVM